MISEKLERKKENDSSKKRIIIKSKENKDDIKKE